MYRVLYSLRASRVLILGKSNIQVQKNFVSQLLNHERIAIKSALLCNNSLRRISTALTSALDDRHAGICWKCRASLTSSAHFFCEKCKALLPPLATLSFFDVFEAPKEFSISLGELHKKYKDLQRAYHPDKHSLSSSLEKEISETISSFTNKAYNTLLDPLHRALYILELNGIIIEEDSQVDDSEFLMCIMELNEKIAEADSDDELLEIRNEVNSACLDLISKISTAFADDRFEVAKLETIKLRYYKNMSAKLKQLIPPS